MPAPFATRAGLQKGDAWKITLTEFSTRIVLRA